MVTQPQLAAPGKGLPPVERWVASQLVFWSSRCTTEAQSTTIFQQEHDNLLALVHSMPPDWQRTPVLIKRLPGLEDSSRYWSALMVLEHLNIVNLGTLENIRHLEQGRLPEQAVRIEDVKPNQATDAEVVASFESACQTYVSGIRALEGLQSPLTHPHPWFGPMTSSDWHFMMGFHMRLHRKQMAAIVHGCHAQGAVLRE